MRDASALAAILGPEWAILPDAMRSMIAIVEGGGDPAAVEARLGRPLENSHRVEMRGSVAVIPVVGPLFRHANMLTEVSGATSYGMIAQDLQQALDDPGVSAIVLNIDSPGGAANGVAELASHIFEARNRKEVVAYVGGTGASAAYWLASAASRIVANRTAMLGSVGVVVGVRKGDGQQEIVSSQSPYKRVDPSTAEGKARIQALVDNLAAIFIEDVAKHRKVDVAHVSTKFGRGDVLLGQAALDAGMVDALGTFEGLIADLQERTHMEKKMTMSAEQLRTEYPDQVAQIQSEAAAAARAELDAAKAATATAVVAERDRILGIIDHAEAKDRAPLARKLAGMPTMSIEGAAEIMSATPKAVVVPVVKTPGEEFEAEMQRHNPAVKADLATGAKEDEEAACLARMQKY